jgi:putative FmdB family regulatory protein
VPRIQYTRAGQPDAGEGPEPRRDGAGVPLYEYQCVACDALIESLQRREISVLACRVCGGPAGRLLSRPARIVSDLTPYYDHGLGQVITSRAERARVMAQQGVIERGTTRMDGARGTSVSAPGVVTRAAPRRARAT